VNCRLQALILICLIHPLAYLGRLKKGIQRLLNQELHRQETLIAH